MAQRVDMPISCHAIEPNNLNHTPCSQHVETCVIPQWHNFVISKAQMSMFEGCMVVNTLLYQ